MKILSFKNIIPVFYILLFALLHSVCASQHYVCSSALGSFSGSDWTNAYKALPTKLPRGDTFFIAAGTYPKYSFADSETDSIYTYIFKATKSEHGTSSGWKDIYGDSVAKWTGTVAFFSGYYVFDGKTGGGSNSWRNNLGFSLFLPTGGSGIMIGNRYGGARERRNINHVTIKHVEVYGKSPGLPCPETGGCGVDLCAADAKKNFILLSYLYLHDLGIMIQGTGGITHRAILEYSCLERNASTTSCHSEGWAAWGGDDSVTVRFNYFNDIEGTAMIALDCGSKHWDIYGNIFAYTQNNPYKKAGVDNGVIAVTDHVGDRMDSCRIYNNSFINIYGYNAGIKCLSINEKSCSGNEAYNNLWYGNQSYAIFNSGLQVCDYSWIMGNVDPRNNSSLDLSILKKQVHAVIGSAVPFANITTQNYHIVMSVPAGKILSSPFNKDLDNQIRGHDGVWDCGAYEYYSPK